jgi:hypothetical protein
LTKYLFPFELASLLLMVAAVGAVVLARRRRGLEEPGEAQFEQQLRMPRPLYTGTMAEAAGLRPGAGTGEGELDDQSEREPITVESPPREGGW